MSEENEFIDWQGGECPVDGDTLVEVKLSGSAGMRTRCARAFNWKHNNYSGNVVAYRVVDDIRPKVEIPEGFTPWLGGECPLPAGTEIDVVLRNGSQGSGLAGGHRWTHGQNLGDIIAYRVRVIEPAKPQVKIPEGFTPWLGGERPFDIWHHVEVIFDDGTGGFWRAGELRWNYDKNLVRNIIAYRDEFEDKKPQTARDIQIGGDHYKKAGIQPWDVVDTWPIEQQIGWYRGNALKYVMRMGTKDENLREIRKAAHYLQKLVEVLEQKGGV